MSGKGLSPVGAGAPAPIIRPQLPKLQELSTIRGRALRIQLNSHFGDLSMARRGLAEVVFGKSVEEARLGRDILSQIIPDNLSGLIAANSRIRDRFILDITEKKLDLQGDARESALDVLGVMATRRALRESAEKAFSALAEAAKPAGPVKVELQNGVAIALSTLKDEISRINEQMGKVVLEWSEIKTSVNRFRSETEAEREKVASVLRDVSGMEMLEVYDRQLDEVDLRLGEITVRSVEFTGAAKNLESAIANRNMEEQVYEDLTYLEDNESKFAASSLPQSLDLKLAEVENGLNKAVKQVISLSGRWHGESRQVVVDHQAKLDKASSVLTELRIDAENTARLEARDKALAKLDAERGLLMTEISAIQKQLVDITGAAEKIGKEASELRQTAPDTQRMSVEELDLKDLEPIEEPAELPLPGLNWEKLAEMISNGMPVQKEQAEAESLALKAFLADFVIELAPVIPEVAEKINVLLGRIKAENLSLYKHALRRDILDKLFELISDNEDAQKAYQILDRLVVGRRTSLPPPPPAPPAVDEEAVTKPKIDLSEVRLPSWSQIPDSGPLPPPAAPIVISSPRELREAVMNFKGSDPNILFESLRKYFREGFRQEIQADLEKTLSEIDTKIYPTTEALREEIDRRVRKLLYEGRLLGYRELDEVELEYIGA